MRYSDRPISSPSEDILGRAGFALELARSIDQLLIAKDGFVIAIHGEWGAGKTSVIELIVRFLRHIEMERASQTSLFGEQVAIPQTLGDLETAALIFDQIKDRIQSIEQLNLDFTKTQRSYRRTLFESWLQNAADVALADRYWRLLLKVQDQPRTIVVRFSPWLIAGRAELAMALLSELARALSERLGDEVKEAFADVLQRLADFAPVLGAGLDATTTVGAGRLLSSGLQWSQKAASRLSSGPTLDEVRNRLKQVLKKIPERQVLVIIDDLDRLTPGEAVEMVSLVKSLGDLPNVIYLLGYDENNLARLIKKSSKVDGHDFLKKIVQYSVHLPPIPGEDLARLLDEDLSKIIGDLSDEDARRLGYTWSLIFRHYLRTPRDVRLFINAVAVSASRGFEHTDVIDLILIELLRLYDPNVYWWVRENLSEITD